MRRFAPTVLAAALVVSLAGLAVTRAQAEPLRAGLPTLTPTPQSLRIVQGEPANDLSRARVHLGGRGAAKTFAKLGVQGPQGLPSGGYVLAISDGVVALQGADEAGTFYGEQTLRQLQRTGNPFPAW